ncbi:unnamed protein product [Caretta caretta]
MARLEGDQSGLADGSRCWVFQVDFFKVTGVPTERPVTTLAPKVVIKVKSPKIIEVPNDLPVIQNPEIKVSSEVPVTQNPQIEVPNEVPVTQNPETEVPNDLPVFQNPEI